MKNLSPEINIPYIFALVLVFLTEPKNALPYIELSIGILFLCWLIIDLTKKIKSPDLNLLLGFCFLPFGEIYLQLVQPSRLNHNIFHNTILVLYNIKQCPAEFCSNHLQRLESCNLLRLQ